MYSDWKYETKEEKHEKFQKILRLGKLLHKEQELRIEKAKLTFIGTLIVFVYVVGLSVAIRK